MDLVNIIRSIEEEEEYLWKKENEKNEGEVSRTINDSGTITYMKLLYKEHIHGCYRLAYELLILRGCVLDVCIYCTFNFHTVQDYR